MYKISGLYVKFRRGGKWETWTPEALLEYANQTRAGGQKVGRQWAANKIKLAATGQKSMAAVLKEARQ